MNNHYHFFYSNHMKLTKKLQNVPYKPTTWVVFLFYLLISQAYAGVSTLHIAPLKYPYINFPEYAFLNIQYPNGDIERTHTFYYPHRLEIIEIRNPNDDGSGRLNNIRYKLYVYQGRKLMIVYVPQAAIDSDTIAIPSSHLISTLRTNEELLFDDDFDNEAPIGDSDDNTNEEKITYEEEITKDHQPIMVPNLFPPSLDFEGFYHQQVTDASDEETSLPPEEADMSPSTLHQEPEANRTTHPIESKKNELDNELDKENHVPQIRQQSPQVPLLKNTQTDNKKPIKRSLLNSFNETPADQTAPATSTPPSKRQKPNENESLNKGSSQKRPQKVLKLKK